MSHVTLRCQKTHYLHNLGEVRTLIRSVKPLRLRLANILLLPIQMPALHYSKLLHNSLHFVWTVAQ